MSATTPDRVEAQAGATPGPAAIAAPTVQRLAALDVFRGLVIVAMVFVNYLAGISGIPAWAGHWPAHLEGYTVVDVVFPAFLFIVGVALPLSFRQRLQQGASYWPLLARTALRSAALILVGVIMVNSGSYSPSATGMSKNVWYLLAMLCVVALWNRYPTEVPLGTRRLHFGIRGTAGLLLGILLLLFRGTNSAGAVTWLQHSWWGILGLIGWAYLTCALIYLGCGGRPVCLMGALGLLLALYVGDKHGVLDWLGPLGEFVAIGPVIGSTAASVMMGVLVGASFLRSDVSPVKRFGLILLFGLGLYLAGVLVRPLHGINKNAATEAYALVCGGWCCLGFALVYFVTDVGKIRAWARPIIPVGQNALLAYILPGMVANLLGLFGMERLLWVFHVSWLGALNAFAVTVLIVFLTWTASRLGIFVRL
ncbi:MAG TPA: DUF5009 domain-containing protein [Clostridia bacterium]|nr:DUF5009 domain-containing protein [Clostridia bacterium]